MQTSPDFKQLQSDFTGRLVIASDQDYDQLRTVFYGGIDKKPAVIILAENVQDIQKGIVLAQSTGLELAVRSGGHSFAAYCASEGGVVLDLRNMKKFEINSTDNTAWVESGMTAGEFTKAADERGLALGFGDTGSVGVGGITLGGGVGFLVRKHGLTIDNLLAAEIVTADGLVLNVDAQNNPDLFWAIRGGGGNFGVVTRFKFQLHPLTEVIGGMLILPAEAVHLEKFMQLADQAPNELSSILNIMPCPPMPFVPAEHHGKLIMMALMVWSGDINAGERVIAQFRSLTPALADTIKTMHYTEMFPPDQGSYHPTAAGQTMFMKHVDLNTAKLIINTLQSSDAQMRVVQLRTLGGKMAEVPADATAFAHRSSQIMVNVAAFYNGPEDQKVRETWVNNFAQQLNQGDNGAYVSFLGPGDAHRVTDAYPEATLKKLKVIKKKYDPQNFFRLNANIVSS